MRERKRESQRERVMELFQSGWKGVRRREESGEEKSVEDAVNSHNERIDQESEMSPG